MIKNKIKVGVIGAGSASKRFHLPVLRKLKEEGIIELIAICDLNIDLAKQTAETFGFLSHTHEAEQIIDHSDIDAVCIFGSAQMHYELGKQVLLSGKHLFVEKPPAPDSQKAFELFELSEEKKLIAHVGFNRRFHKSLKKAKEELSRVSRIYSMEASFHKPVSDRSAPYGGSSWLAANAIHAIDTLVYFAESYPSKVFSMHNIATGNAPQNFAALLVWDNGLFATFNSNNSAGSRQEEYVFHGRDATYKINDLNTTKSQHSTEENELLDDTNENRGFYSEHEKFYKAILGDRPKEENTFKAAAAALRIVEAIEENHQGQIDLSLYQARSTESVFPEKIEGKKAILVLNPTTITAHLPRILKEYRIVNSEDLKEFSEIDKESVVAVITGRGGRALTEEEMRSLPNLSIIGVVGASVGNYNAVGAVEREIPVVNASETYATAVGEFVVMLMIAGLRNAFRSHDVMRKGGWGIIYSKKGFFEIIVNSLRGNILGKILKLIAKPILKTVAPGILTKKKKKWASAGRGGEKYLGKTTVGLIGYGEISKKVITYLKPFGPKIIVFSEHLTKEEAEKVGVERASMEQVLKADIISLHRGLTEKTKHFFGEGEINAMKPGSVLINTARGGLVDEKALINRLRKKDIIACLDVFEQEPLSKKNELRNMENVLLTSHISGSVTAMYEQSAEDLINKILSILKGSYSGLLIKDKDRLKTMT